MRLSDFYDEVWVCDFEFFTGDSSSEIPRPICFVAREYSSGRTIRQWLWDGQHDCLIRTDDRVLYVAFFASAEVGCHIALGWPIPERILDLYPEHKRLVNGVDIERTEKEKRALKSGSKYSLLAAMYTWGLGHIAIGTGFKDEMRALCIAGGPFDDLESDMLDYCESDVTMTTELMTAILPYLLSRPTFDQCLIRGKYMAAVAQVENYGLPIDRPLAMRLIDHWDELVDGIIETNRDRFDVIKYRDVDQPKFAKWLLQHGIRSWPRTETGGLSTDSQVLQDMAKRHPLLMQLKEFLSVVRRTRLMKDLGIASDGRLRTLSGAFGSKTSRNIPSSSTGVWGAATFVRSLIRPEPDHAIWYCDYSGQELGIAAAMSGDGLMLEDYASGDPYMAAAKRFGMVPEAATKQSHPHERDVMKVIAGLGAMYGGGPKTIAATGNMRIGRAKYVLRQHKHIYRRFWAWRQSIIDHARLGGDLESPLGWKLHTKHDDTSTSLSNWMMQTTASDMLRIATTMAVDRGVEVVAMVHDALMIHCPIDQMETARDTVVDCMRSASEMLLDGFRLRVDFDDPVVWPDRYRDKRGAEMWELVNRELAKLEASNLHETGEVVGLDLH